MSIRHDFVGALVLVCFLIAQGPAGAAPTESSPTTNPSDDADGTWGSVEEQEVEIPLDLDAIRERTPKLIFFKNHQVGGTTISQVLIDGYEKLGLSVCCKPGCHLCATHASLHEECLKRECLGDKTHTKMVTILREPIDRAIAKFFFVQVTGKHKKMMNVKDLKSLSTDKFLQVYDPSFSRHPGKRSWVRSEFVNRLLGRQVNDEITETDVMKAAEKLSTTFDAVGITSEFDKFMVHLSDVLGWPLSMLTYKRLKVIQNRPTVTDFPGQVVVDLREVLMPDRVVYGRAVQYAEDCHKKRRGFGETLARYLELQSKVDQTCHYEGHDAKQLKGSDCYDLE